MILNILMSLSIGLTSAIGLAQVFIKAQKNFISVKKNFDQFTQNKLTPTTRSSFKNQRGSISLFGAILTVILSGIFYFILMKEKIILRESIYRKQNYLCFHYLNVKTENYFKEMADYNIALRALFVARTLFPKAEPIYRMVTQIRNVRHLYYMTNIKFNSYCPGISLIGPTYDYIKNSPFELTGGFLLKTRFDQTSILRGKKWKTKISLSPSGVRRKEIFSLVANWEVDSEFMPKINLKTEENRMMVFSNLKCLFGSLLCSL